ncbi:hypothetical protein OG444_22905 [Streptomyces sp. NBC_01232]|uniref:hypothetical protein n=1 Tax=Streptomyces sp. NBC_01232 TaxID=2903786 RepID=UPI002E0D7578|nr:hypothetical protein OG444_22905 [Streptomyces sp. NBC_01232]
MTSRTSTRTPGAVLAPGSPGIPGGEWPRCPYTEELLVQARRERARRELTLGSIRASLEEQPSATSARAAARRWVADVLALAEHVATDKTETAR